MISQLCCPDTSELLHADWNALRPKVLGTITDAFLSYQHDLDRFLSGAINPELPLSASEVNQILKAWPGKVEPGDTIISFNWDLLHEATLYKAGKWMPSDGYGFNGCGEVEASPIKLLKLHGSVNWAQDSARQPERVILHTEQFFPGAQLEHSEDYLKELGSDLGRPLVIPTYIKTISSAFLFQLWDEAANTLRVASQITIIGYSLQPADSLARQLLGTSLVRKEKPAIEVINPGMDYWDEFLSTLGLGFTRIRKKFEHWVLT